MATVTDYDGNTYSTVVIGTQEWFTTNLKVKHLTDGTALHLITRDFFERDVWYPGTIACCAGYNGFTMTWPSIYGLLYNYAAVATAKLAPTGYHIPTATEWATLISCLGTSANVGGILKETGTTHWLTPNTGATDANSFAARPGGFKDADGAYWNIDTNASFWSATSDLTDYDTNRKNATAIRISYDSAAISTIEESKSAGLSIRCIKN